MISAITLLLILVYCLINQPLCMRLTLRLSRARKRARGTNVRWKPLPAVPCSAMLRR